MAQEQKLMELLLSGPVRGLKEASSGENIPYRKRAGLLAISPVVVFYLRKS